MSILKKGKFIVGMVIILLALFGGYKIVSFFLQNDDAKKAEAKPLENYRVHISNQDFKKVQEIEFKSGYRRPYDFKYEPEKNQNFLFEDSKNDNVFKSFVHDTDKVLNQKSMTFDVHSITMLGYDTKELKPTDITYEASTKTLYVKPPHLQMIIMMDYSNNKTKEGLFTYMFDHFTPDELDAFHNGARKEVENKFLNEKEKESGYDLTNKSFKKAMLESSNAFSVDVKDVEFEKNNEPVEVVNDQLTKKDQK